MAELTAGILSKDGKTSLPVGEDVYTGKSYTSLSAAAAANSTVAVAAGTYADGERTNKSNVTVIGEVDADGKPLAVFSGYTKTDTGSGAVLYVAGKSEVKNLIFSDNAFYGATAGSAGGGAMYAAGTTTLNGLTFSGNTSTNYGGALFLNGTNVLVKDTLFVDNVGRVGGAVYSGGTTTFSGSTFSGNGVQLFGDATGCAGTAIYGSGLVIVKDNTIFDGNIGAAIYMNTGSLTVDGAVFKDNIGGELGSALYIVSSAKGGHSIHNATFSGNSHSGNAGVIYIQNTGSEVRLGNLTFDSNRGAIISRQGITIDGVWILKNASDKIEVAASASAPLDITVDSGAFLGENELIDWVIDARFTGEEWLTRGNFVTGDGYTTFRYNEDQFVAKADAVINENAVIVTDKTGVGESYFFTNNGEVYLGKNYSAADAAASGEIVYAETAAGFTAFDAAHQVAIVTDKVAAGSAYIFTCNKELYLGTAYASLDDAVAKSDTVYLDKILSDVWTVPSGAKAEIIALPGAGFINNTEETVYGAVNTKSKASTITLKNMIFHNITANDTTSKRLIWSENLTLSGCTVSKNSSTACVYINSSSTIKNSLFTGNVSSSVIQVNSGTLSITDTTICNNTGEYGVGIDVVASGKVILSGVTFTRNTSTKNGGIIRNQGYLEIGTGGIVVDSNIGTNELRFLGSKGEVVVKGLIELKTANDSIENTGAYGVTVDGASFITGDAVYGKVVDAVAGAKWLAAGSNAFLTTDGYKTFDFNSDLYVTANDYNYAGAIVSRTSDEIFVSGKNLYGVYASAVSAAANETVFYLADGSYNETVQISGQTVAGFGENAVFESNSFECTSDTVNYSGGAAIQVIGGSDNTINNITFRNNHVTGVKKSYVGGGALLIKNKSILNDLVFENNTADKNYGGAIYSVGELQITDNVFTGNTSRVGGALLNGASSVIKGSKFINNYASENGAAIYVSQTVTVRRNDKGEGTVFSGNKSSNSGVIYVNSGSVDIDGATFSNNLSAAVATVVTSKGVNKISDTLFDGNANNKTAGYGAVSIIGSTMNISGSTFASISDGIIINNDSNVLPVLNFSGTNWVNASINILAGDFNLTENAAIIFGNTDTISIGAVNFSTGNTLTFNGAQVNFTDLDVEDVTIVVNGADLTAGAVVAAGVSGALDDDKVINN
ncbi:MAG: right-handed parallel beta-helix repeat-containing protein, partial [Lentisphaeria bacterium]|nr:right-handed parallel beta-helix repeat-containing protein [Lentisphaeria bacterium]